ncbi:MAG TPA: hypothetical protein VK890_06045 [Bacteroidia bacterium]|nr:hypothetical protein [Bacteroidia bacterium]
MYSGLKFVFDTASGFDVTVLNNVGDEQYFEGKSKGECWYNWGAYYMFEKYDKDDSLNSVSGNMRKEAHCYDLNTYKVNYKGQLSQRIHTSHCNVDTCVLRFYWYKYFYNTKGLLSAFSDNGRDTSAGKMIRYYYDTQNRLIKKVDMPRTQYPHPSTTQAIYIYEYFQDGMREEILVKKEDGSVK